MGVRLQQIIASKSLEWDFCEPSLEAPVDKSFVPATLNTPERGFVAFAPAEKRVVSYLKFRFGGLLGWGADLRTWYIFNIMIRHQTVRMLTEKSVEVTS